MSDKNNFAFFGAILLSFGLTIPVLATGNCFPIKGKIFNNALGPGSTLGVAHASFRGNKFKCGLRGDGKNQDPNDPNDIGPLNFNHTLVCDDDAGGNLPVHSQLVFDTSGYPTAAPVDCGFANLQSFPFIEESQPVPGTGTGQFYGISDGSITIQGTLFCSLAIDMNFSGELCF
jgi:hypothetical protein